jgi:hypothetical protein
MADTAEKELSPAQKRAAEKAAKDQERAEAAKAKEAEKAEKAKAAEAAKAKKAEEAAAAKAAREQEKVAKLAAELPEEKRPQRGTGPDGAVTVGDVREAIKAHKAEERANKPKLAPLTLSQRRAVLKLKEGDQVPTTDFGRLPLDYLVSVGLAEKFDTERQVEKTKTVEREEPLPEPEGGFKDGAPTTKTVKDKVTETVTEPAVGYRLTDAGKAREVNAKWRDWKPESRSDTPVAAAAGDAPADA